jgi:hypothetical protein
MATAGGGDINRWGTFNTGALAFVITICFWVWIIRETGHLSTMARKQKAEGIAIFRATDKLLHFLDLITGMIRLLPERGVMMVRTIFTRVGSG